MKPRAKANDPWPAPKDPVAERLTRYFPTLNRGENVAQEKAQTVDRSDRDLWADSARLALAQRRAREKSLDRGGSDGGDSVLPVALEVGTDGVSVHPQVASPTLRSRASRPIAASAAPLHEENAEALPDAIEASPDVRVERTATQSVAVAVPEESTAGAGRVDPPAPSDRPATTAVPVPEPGTEPVPAPKPVEDAPAMVMPAPPATSNTTATPSPAATAATAPPVTTAPAATAAPTASRQAIASSQSPWQTWAKGPATPAGSNSQATAAARPRKGLFGPIETSIRRHWAEKLRLQAARKTLPTPALPGKQNPDALLASKPATTPSPAGSGQAATANLQEGRTRLAGSSVVPPTATRIDITPPIGFSFPASYNLDPDSNRPETNYADPSLGLTGALPPTTAPTSANYWGGASPPKRRSILSRLAARFQGESQPPAAPTP